MRRALLGLLALCLTFEPTRSEADFNCSDAYARVLGSIELRKVSPEQRARLRRDALRVYQACLTGDLHDPKALFDRVDRSRS
jgi:hypothetical protein